MDADIQNSDSPVQPVLNHSPIDTVSTPSTAAVAVAGATEVERSTTPVVQTVTSCTMQTNYEVMHDAADAIIAQAQSVVHTVLDEVQSVFASAAQQDVHPAPGPPTATAAVVAEHGDVSEVAVIEVVSNASTQSI